MFGLKKMKDMPPVKFHHEILTIEAEVSEIL